MTSAPLPLREQPLTAMRFGSMFAAGVASSASMMRLTPHAHAIRERSDGRNVENATSFLNPAALARLCWPGVHSCAPERNSRERAVRVPHSDPLDAPRWSTHPFSASADGVARTPLFSRLRRNLSLALHAEASGRPTLELVEQATEQRRLSRRRFLAASGALAASSAAPKPASARPHPRPGGSRIAINGAGLAGLTCAYRLEQAGLRARLFDSWNRVGGRMFSARGWRDDQVAELGGELIDTGHEALRGLASELGLQLDPILEEPGSGVLQDTWFFGGRAVSDAQIVEAFRAVAPQLASDAASEDDDAEFTRLDELGLEAYLDALPDLDPVLRELLAVAYLVEYGREISEQSTWNLLWLIDSENPDPFRVYGDSDEAFHLHGGSDLLPARLLAQLQSPVALEHQLVSVVERADGAFRLVFERGTRSPHEEVFDQVVFALPFTRLRQVRLQARLPAIQRQIIAELGMGTNAKLMGQFRERTWRTEHGASGSATTDNGLQQLWETSRGQRGKSGILTVFAGGETGEAIGKGSAESQLRARLAQIDQIYPGSSAAYLPGSAVRMHWPSVEHTLGSYACYLPGQASFVGLEGERAGHLHFCGEHTSVDFQGYMNGGVESGERVAIELQSRAGRRAQGA